jgi:hypothetical protein
MPDKFCTLFRLTGMGQKGLPPGSACSDDPLSGTMFYAKSKKDCI